MDGLPDPQASRAVLVGTSAYARGSLPDLPSVQNNLIALAEVLHSNRVWGLPLENCAIVHNPLTTAEMLDPVVEASRDATDTLLIYYAGHGLIDSRHGELHLCLAASDPQRIYTAVYYGLVRDELLDSRAARRVVILDCCYSGRALGTMANPVTTVMDEASAEGTYIMAAASENRTALAPPGEPFTAFTAELLNIFQQGIPGSADYLDLDTIYSHVVGAMREKSRPLPQKRDRNTAGRLRIARNRANEALLTGTVATGLQVQLGPGETAQQLLTELSASESFVRSQAAAALGEISEPGDTVLKELRRLERSDPAVPVRFAARNALLALGCAADYGMIRIPAGEFIMGTSDQQRAQFRQQYGWDISWTISESPQRRLHLSEFFIERTPVTNAQFAAFVEATGYKTVAELEGVGFIKTGEHSGVTEVPGVSWLCPRGPDSTWQNIPDHPVVLLTWPDVITYAEWSGKQLPTEAQWEKAARGTDGRVWPWGDEWEDGLCNDLSYHAHVNEVTEEDKAARWWRSFDQLSEGPLTTPVGQFPGGASPYGLLDCAGNVCERTLDWYKRYPGGWDSSEHYGERYHVLRGGAFHHGALLVRTTARDFAHPLFRTFHDGFRCVVNPLTG